MSYNAVYDTVEQQMNYIIGFTYWKTIEKLLNIISEKMDSVHE